MYVCTKLDFRSSVGAGVIAHASFDGTSFTATTEGSMANWCGSAVQCIIVLQGIELSNENRVPFCFKGFVGDEILPSYVGINYNKPL